MKYFKVIVLVILIFIGYKGFTAIKNFEIGVSDRVVQIEKKAEFEKNAEVIALMMYLGDPLELQEHLFVSNKSKCIEMKEIAEESSSAYYECAIVDATVKGDKIIKINSEIEVF